MAEKKVQIWIVVISITLLFLVIFQAFSFYLIYKNEERNIIRIDNLDNSMNKKLGNLSRNVQENINFLSNLVTSLSSAQKDINEQLGELKARTSADFSGIIENEIKGVVTIKTDISQGTGFFVTDTGYIVTNAHVLSYAKFVNIYTYDGNKYRAGLVGYDSDIDIALLKISGEFSELTLGDSDDVKIGEKVIAIGNPLGLSFTATEGIISARDRKGSNDLPYYFQTDVSLNPGNSGGPLINTKGEVIGINNFKISGAENIGFALESNYIKRTINEISLENLNMTII